MGKMAMPPLPSRGSQPLQSGGQNQKWPTSGQSGYATPAVSGILSASERGGKSEVPHLWAKWLRHPCRLVDPHRFRAGGKIRSGPRVGKVAASPLPSRGSPPLQSGKQNQKWRDVHKVATSPLPPRGSPPLRSGGGGGGESEVGHKWAKWLLYPCRLGDPHHFRAGGKIRTGPQVGKVPTSALRSRGSRPLQSGGQNQKWPTSGQSGYLTHAVSGIPTASERGESQNSPTCGHSGYVTPTASGIPTAAEWGGKSEVAHKWTKWPRHPCRIGDPHRFKARGKIRSGPLVGKVATAPVPSRGSPPL